MNPNPEMSLAARARAEGVDAHDPMRQRNALVIEGLLRARHLMVDAVRSIGATEIFTCERATDALDDLRTHRFDLVVFGQVTDGGYDAALLLEQARAQGLLPLWTTVVVIASGRDPRSVTGLAAHAPDALVLKPFSAGQLRERLLQAVLAKRPIEGVLRDVERGAFEQALAGARALPAAAREGKLAAYRALCERQMEVRRGEGVEEILREAAQYGPLPWMTLLLARLRSMQSDHDMARALLRKLQGSRPEFIASYDAMAGVEAASGNVREAVKHLEEAGARTGFNLNRLRRLGDLATRSGEFSTAERVLDQVLARVQDTDLASTEDYVNLAGVLAERGKLERSSQVARELRSTQSDHPDVPVIEALVAWRRALGEDRAQRVLEGYQKVLESFEQAGPEVSVDTQVQVIEACIRQGERERALGYIRALALSRRADRQRLEKVRRLLEGSLAA